MNLIYSLAKILPVIIEFIKLIDMPGDRWVCVPVHCLPVNYFMKKLSLRGAGHNLFFTCPVN